MPVIDNRPTTWEEISKEKFFIINDQYNIAANKDIQTSRLLENIVNHFKEWKCFIVWSKDKS